MGNSCDSIKSVAVINRCSKSFDDVAGSNDNDKDKRVLDNFCTYSGAGGKSYRKQWCSKIGANEWEYDSQKGSCTYNDCSPYQAEDSGCCNGCCGIAGGGVQCKRKSFTGTSIKCCLNDYSGCGLGSNGSVVEPPIGLCFSDALVTTNCNTTNCKNTCNPCQRDVTSNGNTLIPSSQKSNKNFKCSDKNASGCQNVLFEYCTGEDLDKSDSNWVRTWIRRWMNDDGTAVRTGCLNVLVRNIYKDAGSQVSQCAKVDNYFSIIANNKLCSPINISGVTRDGVEYASDLLTATLNTYQEAGYIVGSLPGTPGYNPFQEFIYGNICCRFPLVCSGSLFGVCSVYDSAQMSRNPSIANWCGCYLPDSQYQKYVNEYQVDKQCTPLCNRNTSIPLVNVNNVPLKCDQDICIIDDLAIHLAQTNISGAINISQMCGNCSGVGASCGCFIENNNVTTLGGQFQNINFNQSCTGQTCTVTDPLTKRLVTVPCDQVENDPSQTIKDLQAQQEQERLAALNQRNKTILIILGVALAVIILAFLLIRPRSTKVVVKKVNIPAPSEPDKSEENINEAFNNLGINQNSDGSYLIGQNYVKPTFAMGETF